MNKETTVVWGIYDLDRQDFATRSIGFSSDYIGVLLHDESRATVESWLDRPGQLHGNRVEVREIPPTQAHRMRGCICPIHRRAQHP